MERYKVFGLTIESEIPLQNLGRDEAEGDADVFVGVSPFSARVQADSSQVIAGVVPGVASVEIADARWIGVEPDPKATDAQLAQAVVGALLGTVLAQRGKLVLHGCAVVENGVATTLLGPSGSGKSTLASALVRMGAQLLSDDITVIDVDNGMLAMPGAHQIREFPDGRKTLKDTNPVASEFIADPAPVRSIHQLALGEGPQFIPLSESDAFRALAMNTRSAGLLASHRGAAKMHLRLCSAVQRALPIERFQRPRDASAVDDHARAILARLRR